MAEGQDCREFFLEVLKELVAENKGRIPAVKKVQAATGLSASESKDLLADLKPLLQASKGAKVAEPKSVAPEGAPSSASRPTEEEMPGTPKYEIKEEVKEETASHGSRSAASQKALPRREETSVEKQAFTPEYPDNQEGLLASQATELDTPRLLPRSDVLTAKGKATSRMSVCSLYDFHFALIILGPGRSIDTLLQGQNLLKGKSQPQFAPSEDGEELYGS